MKRLGYAMLFLVGCLYITSCDTSTADQNNSSDPDESLTLREAYEDWVIENHGEEYTDELKRLQEKAIQEDLQAHFTGDSDQPVVGIIGGGVAGYMPA